MNKVKIIKLESDEWALYNIIPNNDILRLIEIFSFCPTENHLKKKYPEIEEILYE